MIIQTSNHDDGDDEAHDDDHHCINDADDAVKYDSLDCLTGI